MSKATELRPGVLLVDDDETVRLFLKQTLSQHGFDVWSASSGQEGLALYRLHSSAITVVLLDVNMPGLNGPETLTALHVENPSLPCVFMTGDSGIYRHEEFCQLGAFTVLSKPMIVRQVVNALRRASLVPARWISG
jgi:DNA-binding NtrC family response regulator